MQNLISIEAPEGESSVSENKVTLSFHLAEGNWPFMDFQSEFKLCDSFLVIEDKIKSHHNCIKNLNLYCDSAMKKKLHYKFDDILDNKIDLLKVMPQGKQSKVLIYYQFENGYEWPLLTS